MTRQEELIRLRDEIAKVQYKAANEPAIIRQGGTDIKIQELRIKERELLNLIELESTARYAAEQQAQAANDEEAAKSRKFLITVGSIAGGLLLVSIVAVIIIKRVRKKK